VSLPRRGRPTVRVLREDLGMPIVVHNLDARSPLSEIDHPIVRKAAEAFGAVPTQDRYDGRVKSSDTIPLLEIRTSQWRGGVWIDHSTGQPWLVAAGLAKGEHKDHDDFYERVKRADSSGGTQGWLPTDIDQRQLKREVAAALMVQWELSLQAATLTALEQALDAREAMLSIPHPRTGEPGVGTARVTVEHVGEPGGTRHELLLEVELDDRHKGSTLGWAATLRLLTTIEPRQTAWDAAGGIFSPDSNVGDLPGRILELRELVDAGELALGVPNDLAHYSHRRNLAKAYVEGKGVRTMCGIYFVPTRDHESLPVCPTCDERHRTLP